MTKKDFEAIAGALRDARPASSAALAQWARDVEALCAMCARQSPRFRRGLFLAACGVEGA